MTINQSVEKPMFEKGVQLGGRIVLIGAIFLSLLPYEDMKRSSFVRKRNKKQDRWHLNDKQDKSNFEQAPRYRAKDLFYAVYDMEFE